MVAMPARDEKLDGFFVPSRTQKVNRLPVGVCIAAGAHTDIEVGDHVVVESKYAKAISCLRVGEFYYPGEVWMFGLTSPHVRECRIVGVKHTAIAVVGATEWEACNASFPSGPAPDCDLRAHDVRPEGFYKGFYSAGEGRVVLELLSKSGVHESSAGGPDLLLPDAIHDRPDIATVASTSPACRHLRVGDQVMYMRRGLECMYPGGAKHLAIAPEKAIYAAVRD